jgi:hypothetical protein
MKSYCFPPIRAALLALLFVPACPGDKGSTTDDTSGSSGGDPSTSHAVTTSGGVLTSTSSSTDVSTGAETSGGTDGSTGTGSTGEVSATGTTGEPEIMCEGEPLYFPTFDRSCTAVRDCSVVFHQTDCCGNSVAWGINVDAAKAFGEAEAICQAQYPECGCPAGPATADDGDPVINPDFIEVDCVEGMCMSSVP